MFQKRTGMKPKIWMGILGFLGFLGCLGFVFQEPSAYIFFIFFGFFSFYWWAKIEYDIEDERLIKNQQKALSISFRWALAIIIIGLLVSSKIAARDISNAYSILVIMSSLAVSLGFNVEAYLIYKYENEEF